MPPPLNIDREQVRLLVLSIGVRPAAAKLGIPPGTVQDWSARFGWLRHARTQTVVTPPSIQAPPTMLPKTNPTIQPADALTEILRDDATATRTALSRAVRRASEHASSLAGSDSLDAARRVRETVESASRLHGWEQGGKSNNTVNVISDQVNIGLL